MTYFAGPKPARTTAAEQADEETRDRPSDMFDYYRPRDEIVAAGEWDAITSNFFDKVDSLNRTAQAFTQRGLPFVAAANLHCQR